MIRIIGPKDRADSYINTTSRSNNWSRGLSPFFAGPVDLYDTYTAKNVENAWQFSKCYACHVDENNNPTQEYWKWAETGWNDYRAHRYPMPKGIKPLFSYWEGKKLSYVEARKKIYVPIYAKAVVKTDAFKRLKEIYESEKDIVLWDFDGYDHNALGKTLQEVMSDSNRKMGHSFVLAGLLTGEIMP